MILIDSRIGSGEFLPDFTRLGVSAATDHLSSADFAFTGCGPSGLVSIGIERKTIPDLLDCITTGRLAAGQIPEMRASYDICYLVLEGIWRVGGDGALETLKGGQWYPVEYNRRVLLAQDLMGYITSLETFAGIRFRYTGTPKKTVETIIWLYKWWSKPWGDHGSFKVFHDPIHSANTLLTREPSLCRRWAKELPGIGWTKSAAVEAHFLTAEDMALADINEWQKVDGIGKTLAKRAHDAIREISNQPPKPIIVK